MLYRRLIVETVTSGAWEFSLSLIHLLEFIEGLYLYSIACIFSILRNLCYPLNISKSL